jgi:predicted dehydrogenase
MNTTNPIKFAVVGSGYIGQRHAEMILGNPDSELVAICDTNLQLSDTIKHLNVPFYGTIEQMLSDAPDFDVLCVATPNGLHAEHALIGLQHKKHVVIEKPMALSKADCEKIIFKSLQVSRQVFCVMQNRYSPPSEWIKELVDKGLLGKIFMVQVNCYWNRDSRYYNGKTWKGKAQIDGGTLFTQFSHFVDIMYWLFGDITDIQARFRDFNHSDLTEFEDSGFISFNFKNGGMGAINYSTSVWDKNMESSLVIIAEKGTVKIGGQYMNQVDYCHIDNYTMPELAASNPPNDYGPYKGSASNHHLFYKNVIDTLRSKDTITTNALEGMKVVEIIESIYDQNPYFTSKKK